MKLPLLSGRQVLAALGRLGFEEIGVAAMSRWSIPTVGGLFSPFIRRLTDTR
jgi:hypothetical protein